jgi:methionyl-tRNA formyltransferase
MRVVFAGTPDFALAALLRLHVAGFTIALVLTQPDRPAGRGLKLHASPVKAFALEQGIALAQPRGLKLDGKYADDAAAARAALLAARADVLVVAAYGLILPPWVLEVPRLGGINIHASLLPRWRGAAPIHRAIEAGDAHTGITIMQMDDGLDTGDMLLAQSLPIAADDTTATLQERLASMGGRMIVEALALAVDGKLKPTPQPVDGVTYAHKIDKSEAVVDWTQSATVIERRLRAFDPAPGASSLLGGEAVKCWRGSLSAGQGAPGEVLAVGENGITVACGEGAVRLSELQRPGGKRMAASQFIQGRTISVGMVLGSRGI